MFPPGLWSRVNVFLVLIGSLSGCGEGVQIVRESANAGVVRYFYQEYQGHLLSPNRARALEEMKKFCQKSVQVIREGPAQSRKRVVEGIGGGDVIEERWWGIRFRCLP